MNYPVQSFTKEKLIQTPLRFSNNSTFFMFHFCDKQSKIYYELSLMRGTMFYSHCRNKMTELTGRDLNGMYFIIVNANVLQKYDSYPIHYDFPT